MAMGSRQWVVGNRQQAVGKGIGEKAIGSRKIQQAVGKGNRQWANVMRSAQIEYKQYKQIGGNIYCEIQKIYQDPKTLFFIYVCLVIKENENYFQQESP